MSESSIAHAEQAVFAALAQSRVASGSASGHELIDRLTFLKSVVRQAEHDLLYTVVVRAIRAAMIPAKSADPGGLGRDTSLGQRQAEALGAICEHALDDGYLPAEGGERPHMTAILNFETLRTVGRGPGEAVCHPRPMQSHCHPRRWLRLSRVHDSYWSVRIRDGQPEFVPPKWMDFSQVPRRNARALVSTLALCPETPGTPQPVS
jgi:hypothetical protein